MQNVALNILKLFIKLESTAAGLQKFTQYRHTCYIHAAVKKVRCKAKHNYLAKEGSVQTH